MPLNSAAPIALRFDVGFNLCLQRSQALVHACAACLHVSMGVFLCSLLHVHTPILPQHHQKKKKGKENAMTTQSSDVNLVELLSSTVKRGPWSLLFPTESFRDIFKPSHQLLTSVNTEQSVRGDWHPLEGQKHIGNSSCSSQSCWTMGTVYVRFPGCSDTACLAALFLPSSSFPLFDSRLSLSSAQSLSFCFDDFFPLPFF